MNGQGLLYTAIHADSAEPSSLDQAAKWLQTCLERHPRCASAKRRRMRPPSRLIDVAPETESQDPRLCLANENVHFWVALSYCWGGQSEFVLNDTTIESLMQGVPLCDYPATLRDAVVITRNLGIRHLWVDALCIKQDSEDDWLRECSRMRDVYKGATLTLVAADAPSVDTGIFSKRSIRLDFCQLPWYVSNNGSRLLSGQADSVCIRPCNWNQETEPWPTQQRGWTLQEELLSFRTLSYSKHQMIWECSTGLVDEGGRIKLQRGTNGKDILRDMLEINESRFPLRMFRTISRLVERRVDKRQLVKIRTLSPYHRWKTLVYEYTNRNLTRDTDMLPGIAGLASEFARQTRDTYCAGLWRKKLLVELMWILDPLSASKTDAPVLIGPAEYRAPSWSWASIKGAIRLEPPAYTYYRANQMHKQAKVIAVQIEPLVSSDPFGQVKTGHLILQGRFYHVDNFLEGGSTTASSSFPAAHEFLQAAILLPPGMKQEFSQQHRPCERQRFALLQLCAYTGLDMGEGADYLVLESTTPDASAYRRVGCIILAQKANGVGLTDASADHDPLEFRAGGHKDSDNAFRGLAENAFRELQAANVVEKKVMII